MYGQSPVVTLTQVRYEIGDQPRLNVAPGGMEILPPSPTDGITSSFPLRFATGNPATITLFKQIASSPSPTAPTPPPSYTAVQQTDATYPWAPGVDAFGNPTVQFATAPASGLIFGVRYQVVAFPDAILQAIVNDAVQPTATLVLKAVHYAVIPMILANRDAMTIYQLGDRKNDPSAFIAAQRDLMKMLQTFLDDQPGEGPSAHGASSGGGWGW